MTGSKTVAVAPMLDWTDRHCRYFMRLLSKHVTLYTEMITTGALLYGDRERFLQFHPTEKPVVIQLGGSDPKALAECAKMAEDAGYSEINLNVGCPSERVQSGRFGACLMKELELVAECIAAMQAVVRIPVTVKTRIGVDDADDYEFLHRFVTKVSQAECKSFIIHARKAWLKGLSPKENREKPPLNYERVAQLKKDFPELTIILNGGIRTLSEMQAHLQVFDGVMIGRAAYQDSYLLAFIDQTFYDANSKIPTRFEVVSQFLPYLEKQLEQGIPLKSITRHLLGLYHAQPGAKDWRRALSDPPAGAGVDWIKQILERRQYALVS